MKERESLVLLGLGVAVGAVGAVGGGSGRSLLAAVAVEEEVGKEDGIGEVHDEGEDGAVLEISRVGAGGRGVGDDKNSGEHLEQLQGGEEHVPVEVDASRSESVVEVHERVDEEIHHGEGPAGAVQRARNLVGVPAVDAGHDVVIVVQEDQRLLAQDDEDGVTELEELGDVEEEDPARRAQREAIRIANHLHEGSGHQIVHKFGEGVVESSHREDGQSNVPQDQGDAKTEGLAVLHQVLNTENNGKIQHHGGSQDGGVSLVEAGGVRDPFEGSIERVIHGGHHVCQINGDGLHGG